MRKPFLTNFVVSCGVRAVGEALCLNSTEQFAGFRLIVSGEVGVKEIEQLIKKLQLDKEILAKAEKSKHKLI